LEAANYSALYTDALLDALLGTRLEVLESGETDDEAQYVKPWRLHDYLVIEIPRRVKALRLEKKVNQNPDSIITSRNNWLARIDAAVAATRSGRLTAPPAAAPPIPNLRMMTRDATVSAAEGRQADLDRTLHDAVAAGIPGAAQFAGTLQHLAEPFGPSHFESHCGIKVRGARIVSFLAPLATGSLLGHDGDLLRIDRLEGPGVSVLLRLENGTGCVVPVVQGFLSAVTFDDGELVDVAYEPSANTWRWDVYQQGASEVRALRGVAATASRHGRFRLDPRDAEKFGKRMQYAKGIDPTLAVYAAYAYHDLQLTDRIREMSRYLVEDLGVTFFDLELLGRRLVKRSIDRNQMIVPFVPLLSQGWSLLHAHRVKLHPALNGIEETMLDSLWTQFNGHGVEKLEHAMLSREVR
jgi:hypothetical protein